MSYLGRLIAMSRGDERVLAPGGGAGPSSAELVLEQHDVVVRPAAPPIAATRAPVAGPAVREPPAPPRSSSPPPMVTGGDPVRHEVDVAPRPPASAVVRPADVAVRAPVQQPSTAAAAAAPRAPAPSFPGIQTLREVMHWIAQPPPAATRDDASPPPRLVVEAAPPLSPPPRSEAGRAPAPLAREAAVAIEHVERGLSIGAIEVTIEAPPPPAPRPRPERPARRDTRLERRLPRGG